MERTSATSILTFFHFRLFSFPEFSSLLLSLAISSRYSLADTSFVFFHQDAFVLVSIKTTRGNLPFVICFTHWYPIPNSLVRRNRCPRVRQVTYPAMETNLSNYGISYCECFSLCIVLIVESTTNYLSLAVLSSF